MIDFGRAWAEIDLDAVQFNVEEIKKHIDRKTKIMAVIKTDGYGHGAVRIARMLEQEEQVWGCAVATAEEAFVLRSSHIKKPVLVLGYTFPYSYERFIEEEVRPAVFTLDTARSFSDKAVEKGKMCKIHIKIDTGMGRIGICPDEKGLLLIQQIAHLPGIVIEGIFTHFATADESNRTKAYRQLTVFQEYTAKVEQALGYTIPVKHCANSAAIIEMPETGMDVVRAGIILYGLWPSAEVQADGKIQLKPALSLKSRIVYVKMVPAGQEISYGGTFTTVRETRVATICLGYGDGYPRSLSNVSDVLVRGHRAPILGRVCMDQFMVDITDIQEEIQIGEIVTLIGTDGEEQITMEELGECSGRFNYELACDLGKRVPRVYKHGGNFSAIQEL